ncbi:uncharacterized protein KZ484_004714 [Pholidichthys leucotaenia]
MEIATLCAAVAFLRVFPSRTQFFNYESVTLSCELQGNSSGWRIKRNTSTNINEDCSSSRNGITEPNCVISDLYPSDGGIYWCESEAGECSNVVNITVTRGSVILESPVHPVMEGESVTLLCRNDDSHNFTTATFYKDEVLIGSSSTGNLTLNSISKSDEGFYKCNISGVGQSPDSRLMVRAGRPSSPDTPIAHFLLPVLGVCVVLILLILLCLWRNLKGGVKHSVSYADVTITQQVKLRRFSDVNTGRIFYSTLRLDTI